MGKLLSANFNPSTDLVDLKGKVAIVTGGNKGIGLATVRHLARAGAKVYLAARDESRATGALAQLELDGLGPGNGEVVRLKLDLTDPRDVKKAAEEFLKRETRLDLSSIVHKFLAVTANFHEITDFNTQFKWRPFEGLYRYGYSKFLMVLWTKTLQRRLNKDPSAPILVISLHLGGVDTISPKSRYPRLATWVYSFLILNTDAGAYNSVFAARGKKVKNNRKIYEGAYLETKPTGKIAAPHKKALDEALGDRLWDLTDRFLRDIGVDVEA